MWTVFRNVNNAINLLVGLAFAHLPTVNINVRHCFYGRPDVCYTHAKDVRNLLPGKPIVMFFEQVTDGLLSCRLHDTFLVTAINC